MEDKRIKSAWEIALERADKLGKLTSEEKRKQQEEKYAPVGQALAQRFLSGQSPRDLDLEKYQGEERGIVVKAALAIFVEALELTDASRALRALEGVRAFSGGGEAVEGIGREIEALLREHKEAQEKERESSQGDLRKRAERQLRERGIGGSAVRPNLQASRVWRGTETGQDSPYAERLALLKGRLLGALKA
ncbi:MAG: hypothetical protein Q8O76_13420 [Chloroflexota bacterium]|nr:hypothetical protein [Chloroflexota bacterium]